MSIARTTLLLALCIELSNGFVVPRRLSAGRRSAAALSPWQLIPTTLTVQISDRFPSKRRWTTAKKSELSALPWFPLIAANDAWGNWAALSGLAALSQVMGKRTVVGRLLGPPVTAMALSFAAATMGVLNPGGTVAARSLQLLSLQMATPLILLGADLRDAAARCGPLLISFAVAAASTVVACFVGWQLTGPSLIMALGRDGLVIAAALLAKNVGGGINCIAVCRSFNANPTAVAAGLCVDNLFALVYFPVTSALASGRPDVVETTDDTNGVGSVSETSSENVSVQRISTVLFLSAALLWLGEKIGGDAGSLPVCTILTVLVASFAPAAWISPLRLSADNLSLVALYLFFATAGAPGMAVAESVHASLLPLGLYLTCLYSIHGALLCAAHKMFPSFGAFQPQRLLVASSAAIGGPATAVALTTAASWKSLSVPSILVGNIGYAIATFCGLAFHAYFS